MTKDINLDEVFAAPADILRALGYDVAEECAVGNELEDYAESYIYHDAYVNVTEFSGDESRQSVVFDSEGVVMWALDFPATLRQFHEYLDELDQRIGRMRIIAKIPTPDHEDGEAESIASVIGLIFGVDAERVYDDLGSDWTSINSDAVGFHTNPVSYVRWNGHLVVGFDDQYVYVFRTDPDGNVLDAYVDGGISWEAEWPEMDGDLDYDEFVRTLRKEAVAYTSSPQ